MPEALNCPPVSVPPSVPCPEELCAPITPPLAGCDPLSRVPAQAFDSSDGVRLSCAPREHCGVREVPRILVMGVDPCETNCPPAPQVFECTEVKTLTQSFTRNNCPIGTTAGTALFSVSQSASAFSLVSQADACLKAGLLATDQAQADLTANGQAYANANALCVGGVPECRGIMSLNVQADCPKCIGSMVLDVDVLCPPPPCVGSMTLVIDAVCPPFPPPPVFFGVLHVDGFPQNVTLGICNYLVNALISGLPEGCVVDLQATIGGLNVGAIVQRTVLNGVCEASVMHLNKVAATALYGWKVTNLSCANAVMGNPARQIPLSC